MAKRKNITSYNGAEVFEEDDQVDDSVEKALLGIARESDAILEVYKETSDNDTGRVTEQPLDVAAIYQQIQTKKSKKRVEIEENEEYSGDAFDYMNWTSRSMY